jgi:parallel beta-helix repeat protein
VKDFAHGIWVSSSENTIFGNTVTACGVAGITVGNSSSNVISKNVLAANELGIFARIVMPLAKSALTALSIFTFQWAWNDLLHPLVYLPTDMQKTTLTVGLAFFQQQLVMGGKFTVLMAGALISILPLILVFFIAQRQFVEGIALTGVKR